MEFFKRIFHRHRKEFRPQPKQLRIDGVKTTLTPKPDDAELAAQALLESIAPQPPKGGAVLPFRGWGLTPPSGGRGADYYRSLSCKIRAAHEAERRAALRYVVYVEQQLSTPLPQGEGQEVGLIERELYKHQDAVEREGGELLKRWRHCLAEVIVRQMVSDEKEKENEE